MNVSGKRKRRPKAPFDLPGETDQALAWPFSFFGSE